ncbi:unnamed protein product, partial [Discosporangium mesarthrocarpum]
ATEAGGLGKVGLKPIASCPDMTAFGAGGGTFVKDNQRRTRRLERNRASARVRRQRKKDLVSSHEVEVERLTASMESLRQHKWGTGDQAALQRAIDMERDLVGEVQGEGEVAWVKQREAFVKSVKSHAVELSVAVLESHGELLLQHLPPGCTSTPSEQRTRHAHGEWEERLLLVDGEVNCQGQHPLPYSTPGPCNSWPEQGQGLG